MTDQSPTLRGRELARKLRDLRKQDPDLTIEKVAKELGVAAATISRIETGARPATRRNILALCALYGVDNSVRTQLLRLASEASEQGWWSAYGDLGIDPLIGLEIAAAQISSYESCVIPWIFQTSEYARAVIKGILPGIDDSVLGERTAARLKRQEILTAESPPNFWSLVDESALYRRVGSSQIMHNQLTKMREVADSSNITLQIVPFNMGAHPGLDNTFTLLEFRSASQGPIVYVENMAGVVYQEHEADIKRYKEALSYISAGALDPDSSARLIEQTRKTFECGQ